MTTSQYIHLRVHSAYSLAEGAIPIKQLPKLCTTHHMPALGLTDTANMFGSLEFSETMVKNGIQPVMGCQLYVMSPFEDNQVDVFAVYAQNEQGLQNLFELASICFLKSAHPSLPACAFNDLIKFNEGLIILSGGITWQAVPKHSALGLHGVYKYIHDHKKDEAINYLRLCQQQFNNRFYLEITRHGMPQEEMVEEALVDAAFDLNIPIVGTNHVFFDAPKVAEAHDALLCINDGAYVTQEERRKVTPEHYFKSPADMCALFADIPEATVNTLHIAQRCAIRKKKLPPILPPFDTGEGRNEEEELRHQAKEGLEKRLENQVFHYDHGANKEEIRKTYYARLEEELGIIIQMGFPGYFLIVSDFIQWAKNQGIPVGPGRGSGAGSLVAWSLTITDMDPIRFGLIFERFLNPERVSMPDFDVDFCQERRDEVIHYVLDKYGHDKVAQIITFGKLQARAVLRDVGRVLHMPYGQVDKISKLVPNNPNNPVTLEQAIELEPELQTKIKEEPEVERLVDFGKQLEGLYRHASTHAAGIVIGDRPLQKLVPLFKDPDSDIPVTQYHMKDVEAAGLVKFDFLGLKTLTVIRHACEYVKLSQGVDIDISKIPLDDPKSFELLTATETVGVFQLESGGMKDVLRKLRPDRFEDIIAIVALYRPGPMDDIPRYISCKHGDQEVTYLHPTLKPILETTFGVMVYQEQVMKIAQDLAGYSLGAADLLRRAMGKKIKAEMDKQRGIFIEGAVKNDIPKDTASLIFDAMAKFASYGFNKSHSAPYALLAYQTAYLKANYPIEFFAATMGLDMHQTEKLAGFIQDMRQLKYELLPPDVNASNARFKVENGALRYALAALKGVGLSAMEEVQAEREANGPFKSIFDFCKRLPSKVVNKRIMEGLIKGGCFDSLHSNRAQLVESLDILTNLQSPRQEDTQQMSMFSMAPPKDPELREREEWPLAEKLKAEHDVIGFYLSAHPLDNVHIPNVLTSQDLAEKQENGQVRIAGVITKVQKKMSRKGTPFAFVQISDPKGVLEITLFSEMLQAFGSQLEEGKTVVVEGSFQREDEATYRIMTNNISTLESVLAQQMRTLTIKLHNEQDTHDYIEALQTATPGSTHISFEVPIDPEKTAFVKLPQPVSLSLDLYLKLKNGA